MLPNGMGEKEETWGMVDANRAFAQFLFEHEQDLYRHRFLMVDW
jgi:hypothetical protein